jgi:hypothetical protein
MEIEQKSIMKMESRWKKAKMRAHLKKKLMRKPIKQNDYDLLNSTRYFGLMNIISQVTAG